MKKLLILLSVLTIGWGAVPTTIAANPYYNKQKKIRLENNSINYSQTNNLKNLIRHKRQNDELKNSNSEFNEIGEITEEGLLWGKNHKCYFIKLTPVFWREIINLYNENNKDNFLYKAEKIIKNEFNNYFDSSYYLNTLFDKNARNEWKIKNYLGSNMFSFCDMIYENWNKINNEWKNSNKINSIRILFEFKPKISTLASTFAIMHNIDSSLDPESIDDIFPDTSEFVHYISSNISYGSDENENCYKSKYYQDNKKIANLKNDFPDLNKDSINLGIIDNENDETILSALKNKYQNLKISEIEIFDKTPYSYINKSASAKIKIKIENNNSDYPKIILKSILFFLSKIKLEELSNKIKNEPIIKDWKNKFDTWQNEINRQIKEDLTKYGDDERGKALKRTWSGNIITEANNKLYSLKSALEIIENKYKIDELGNILIKEINILKNDIDFIDNNINEIYKIKNPNPSFYKKNLSDFKTLANKSNDFLKSINYNLPAVRDYLIIIEAIWNIVFVTVNLNNNNSEDITTQRKKINIVLDNSREIEYGIKKKYKDIVKSILNQNNNNKYDVPSDNSCLFWSVASAYLLPVRNNNEEFRTRFIQLFGEKNLINLSHIQKLLKQFNLENHSNNQLWYNDETSIRLIRTVFRNRVVNYIIDNLDNSTQINQDETFRDAIQISENEVAINYLERMREENAWGGEIEILGISNFLNFNISVNNNRPYQPVNKNSNNNIQIFHVNGNHYNFGLENQNSDNINNNSLNFSNKKGGGQSQSSNINKILNKPININIANSQETTTKKLINKYNSLSKEEKQQKLNEINKHYQKLSENDKKVFKDKLRNTGLGLASTGISGAGILGISKMTGISPIKGLSITANYIKNSLSTTRAVVSSGTREAAEMTPLLSESAVAEGLMAAETLSVTEGSAVLVTEGAIIGSEAGAAATLAPETLGLSLVIGGLVIAGTAIIWWLSNNDNNSQAVKHESHNKYNEIEKYYKFLAHDQLKLDININEWNKIKQIYQENKNNYQEFKNKIKLEITNFHKEEHSGWGGSITDNDINTLISIIYNHFQEINNHFLSNNNHGWKIVTNTIGGYFIIEEE